MNVMDGYESTPKDQSPSQRAIAIASLASFASLMFFYWVAKPVVALLEIGWAELLVYAIIPIAVAFTILYRSGWHCEITGAARTCSLFLLSGIILGSELIAIGFIFCLATFCLNAIQGGNH